MGLTQRTGLIQRTGPLGRQTDLRTLLLTAALAHWSRSWFPPFSGGSSYYLDGDNIYVGDGSGKTGFLTLVQKFDANGDDYSIGAYAASFVIGRDGGTGTLTIEQSQQNAAERLMYLGDGMLVGLDAGSTGVVNLLGSGKNQGLEDVAVVETDFLGVGVNGGSGTINIDGGFWTAMFPNGSPPLWKILTDAH